MSIRKQFLKTKPICKVTFRVPKEQANGAETISIAGDFNGWNVSKTPMDKLKNGSFKIVLDLETEVEYQFRYFIDGKRWENENEADKELPTSFPGEVNSVIVV